MSTNRDAIEHRLRILYDIDDRTSHEDETVDGLEDLLAEIAQRTGTCREIGCRTKTDGWAYCPEHGGPA